MMAPLRLCCVLVMLMTTYCISETIKDATINEQSLDGIRMMSLNAQQTLFDELGHTGLDKIKEAVPLYRHDLPEDYIAYWLVEFNTHFITVSSGPETGDHDILSSGVVPPTYFLRDKAKSRGHLCVRFYVLTSAGDMTCTDQSGKIVATDIPENLIFRNVTSADVTTDMIDEYIRAGFEEQAMNWRAHARRIKKQKLGDVDEDELMAVIQERIANLPSDVRDQLNNTADMQFEAQFITPGHPVEVIVGNLEILREVRIRYVVTDAGSTELRAAGLREHEKLCQAIKDCLSANQKYVLLSTERSQPTTTRIILELNKDTKKIFKDEEFVFALDLLSDDGTVTSRHFAVEYETRRQKRSSSYSNWSEWTVDNEDLFPDYKQFTYNRCPVGCGPVAWAMIFGYYDRRSHLGSRHSGSEKLYRSGRDGTTGDSSEVAPSTVDSRMSSYISKLNEILGTVCVPLAKQGATLHFSMDKVDDFFRARQSTGRPKIVEKAYWLSWAGIYSNDVESWTKNKIQAGWPVIVGWRSNGYLGWHYPVATKVKVRTRRYKRCSFWGCSTKTSTESKMYLHMGWGGYRNNWYNLEAYYAVAAVY